MGKCFHTFQPHALHHSPRNSATSMHTRIITYINVETSNLISDVNNVIKAFVHINSLLLTIYQHLTHKYIRKFKNLGLCSARPVTRHWQGLAWPAISQNSEHNINLYHHNNLRSHKIYRFHVNIIYLHVPLHFHETRQITLRRNTSPDTKSDTAISCSLAHQLHHMVVRRTEYWLRVHIHNFISCTQPSIQICCTTCHNVSNRYLGTSNALHYLQGQWKHMAALTKGKHQYTHVRRLTTGIRSEKCVIRRFRLCVNVYLPKPR